MLRIRGRGRGGEEGGIDEKESRRHIAHPLMPLSWSGNNATLKVCSPRGHMAWRAGDRHSVHVPDIARKKKHQHIVFLDATPLSLSE